ncbi:RHS repeat-associated core domain-containing protein [Persicimonas caeni]|uniref:RHS repeat-associated core domain-containing protein n=1 Tax=Persicimonas caeni TaxID=2292766 RepID=A0A4Y6PV45_PERCE|nr:RHS repeat-associated core domain-containing protein [Persicimonas caeni]QDG52178.1 RHS repeat-associated core domain-containing protein [Persicimonas caeni]QED33400.1 RHS repeat-associated core domain-containing protein [Persicimonas caeni]
MPVRSEPPRGTLTTTTTRSTTTATGPRPSAAPRRTGIRPPRLWSKRLEGGEQLVTQTTYDIRGNVLTVVDPKGRTAATQFYDLADRKLRNESIDAGTSIAVFDAVGTPIEARDERGALTLTAADEMLRTTHQWGRDSASEPVRLVGRTIFGHEMANPTATNHLGKPYQHYDEAGVVTLEAYDFKGNALENTREVIDPGLMIGAVDDASSANGYVVDTFRVDWTPAPGETLEDRQGELIGSSSYRTSYKSKSVFDALNRPVQMTLPADQEDADTYGYGKTITPQFNRAGALQSVQMSGTQTPSVDYIAYNAKGQRILAAFGNGVMTRYAYDPNVFRLKRLRSEKYAATSTPESGYLLPSTGKKYQDIVYSYDAVGNILSTDERVTDVGVGGTDTMVRGFEYDALYRLIEATGRESDVLKTDPWQDQLTAKSNAGYTDSPQNTRDYTETYAYDNVGGLSLLTHQYGAGSQWTRNYTIETGSNRMTGMTAGGNAYTYAYDSVGNLVQENTERHFEWDFGGRMRSFRNQITGSAPSVFAHYSYDAGGERVQKVVCRGAKTTRTVYIGGVFEHQQVIENESVTTENQTLHLMDDAKRVATYRAGPELDGADRARTRYHLGDHLQSSNVVLRQVPDSSGKLFVNREEYRPYGETAFGSFEYKRYRFTGKEKDEESGLHYHSARYYAPWLARWTATDPLGMVDGPNLYAYVSGNPVKLVDPSGTAKNGGDQESAVVSSQDVCQAKYRPGLQKVADDSKMPEDARGKAREIINMCQTLETHAKNMAEFDRGGTSTISTGRSASDSSVQTIPIDDPVYAAKRRAKRNAQDIERLKGAGKQAMQEMRGHPFVMIEEAAVPEIATARDEAFALENEYQVEGAEGYSTITSLWAIKGGLKVLKKKSGLSNSALRRSLKGKAKHAKWAKSNQDVKGPGLNDHYRNHAAPDDIDVQTKTEYDLSARITIHKGWKFFYKDKRTGKPRVGYYDPDTQYFTATSEKGGNVTIHTHFKEERGWSHIKHNSRGFYTK